MHLSSWQAMENVAEREKKEHEKEEKGGPKEQVPEEAPKEEEVGGLFG